MCGHVKSCGSDDAIKALYITTIHNIQVCRYMCVKASYAAHVFYVVCCVVCFINKFRIRHLSEILPKLLSAYCHIHTYTG